MDTIDIIQTIGIALSLVLSGWALGLEIVRDRPRLDVIRYSFKYRSDLHNPTLELRIANRSRLANAVEWVEVEQGDWHSDRFHASTVLPPYEIKDSTIVLDGWGPKIGMAAVLTSPKGIIPAAFALVKTVRDKKPLRMQIDEEYVPGKSEPPELPLGPGGTPLKKTE